MGRGWGAQFPKSHLSASQLSSAPKPLTGTVRHCFATWISAPCLPAHQCVVEGWVVILGLCILLTCLFVCLFDDDLPIANLEPGVSGRNSLPLSALQAQGLSWYPRFLCLSIFVLNFASILGLILDLILDQNSLIFQCLFALILKHRFLYDFEGIFVICL